jgi:hypothetical protein
MHNEIWRKRAGMKAPRGTQSFVAKVIKIQPSAAHRRVLQRVCVGCIGQVIHGLLMSQRRNEAPYVTAADKCSDPLIAPHPDARTWRISYYYYTAWLERIYIFGGSNNPSARTKLKSNLAGSQRRRYPLNSHTHTHCAFNNFWAGLSLL